MRMKNFICTVLIMCISVIFVQDTYGAKYYVGDNIATKARVTASSKGSDGTSEPTSVNDGVIENSGVGNKKWFIMNNCRNAWIRFDFDKDVSVIAFRVVSGSLEMDVDDIMQGFELEYLENGKWQKASKVENNHEFDVYCPLKTAKISSSFRVRSITDQRFRIREIELYEAEKAEYTETGENILPGKVVGTNYEQAVYALANLGLLPIDENFDPDDPVTKAEFVNMITRLLNLKDISTENKISVYSDIRKNTKFYNSLMTAEILGITGNDNKSEFCPENEIKFDEALQITVSALGYNPIAQSKGGYPFGYYRTAQSLKLLSGTSKRSDNIVLKGNAVIILYNAARSRIYAPQVYGKSVEYKQMGTLLEEYHKIYETKGIVYSDGIMHLGNNYEEGRITIGDVSYAAPDMGVKGLIGRDVTAWYKNDGGDYELIYAIPNLKNKVIRIDSKDIEPEFCSTSKIKYFNEKGKAVYYKIDSDAYYLVNGGIGRIDSSVFDIDYGYFELIDNNNDNSADVILVHSWQTMVVGGVTDDNIYDKSGGASIGASDADYVITYRNGNEDTYKNLRENDIALVELSGDGSIVRIFATDTCVSGKVTQIDSEDEKIMIDNKWYEIAKGQLQNIALGYSATFHLDTENRIVMIKEINHTSLQYGYMMGLDVKNIGKSRAKILQQDSTQKIMSVKSGVRLNNVSVSSSDIISSSLFDSGKFVPQLVKYNTNSMGEISVIYTASSDSPETDPGYIEYVSDDLVRYADAKNYYNFSGILSENNRKRSLFIKPETVVFEIPSDGEISDEDYKASYGSKSFENNIIISGNIKVYDVNQNLIPGALVYEKKNYARKIDAYGDIAVVSGVKRTTDKDGNYIPLWSLYMGGKHVEYAVDINCKYNTAYNNFGSPEIGSDYASTDVNDVKVGDVIQVNVSDNNINTIRIIARMKDSNYDGLIQSVSGDYFVYSANLETLFGRITALDEEVIQVYSGNKSYAYKASAFNVYIYDSAREEVLVGNKNDAISAIHSSEKVFTRARQNTLMDVMIIR